MRVYRFESWVKANIVVDTERQNGNKVLWGLCHKLNRYWIIVWEKASHKENRPTTSPALAIIIALVVSCALFLTPSKALARQIDTIIIHHTASADVSATTIDKWHRARGWKGIGYHFLIHPDGSLENGRPVSKVGAHAKGRNKRSIGIALIGYNKFTPAQVATLEHLVQELCADGEIKHIYRHHADCPSPGLDVETLNVYLLKNQLASWFSDWETASGKHIFPWTIGCASWFHPMGSKIKITNTKSGKSVICEVIDRGPSEELVNQGRIVDLTPAAFRRIGNLNDGLVPVSIQRIK